ncbi:hypothetical protein OAE25_02190 [Verrucomicrobiales bacterium]|nr:hypothetical protein [Verrucomicrobiales bacterium]MDC0322166.1 hypothetical protein [Verrucomicrobiales bacterium]
MKTVFRFLTLAACSVLFTSCIQHSTVLRLEKDGSGEIFVRNYFSPSIAAMAGGLGGALGGEGEGAGEVTINGSADPAKVDVDQAKADAANYGEGVRYVRHEEGKNKEQWDGHLIVYEFDDINKVVLDANSAMGGKMKQMAEAQGQAVEEQEGGKMTFAHADGVLKIKTGMGEDALKQFQEGGGPGGDQQLPDGMKPSAMMGMMSGMLQGMRMGYFIRINGGIAESNASHVNGEYITLMDVEVSKMLADPEFLAFVDKSAEEPESVTEEEVKALLPQVEAMKAEIKEEVTVKFK